ncbi:hypothetical protein ISF6_2889 [Piscinibacter sakaiensis]|uniref:TonB C-terminal domain-containing protein n=1 Tax=Piscinibacter sakaiensis TaxID=1547922 RepID=A0A0K8P3B5_PISS1|nr:hypothetical protein ISF6_2889 [Piscinibacter sakaiensis]
MPGAVGSRRWAWFRMVTVGGLLAGCSSSPLPPWRPAGPGPAPAAPPSAPATPADPVAAAPTTALRPLGEVRSWADYRLRAAGRLVAMHPQGSYTGPVPEVLLAIPVLEVEVNADGSVRRIEVLRRPGQAPETLQLAIDAVRRAAPYGPVGRLPRPWKFTETFLFDDQRRFKPRTLDD